MYCMNLYIYTYVYMYLYLHISSFTHTNTGPCLSDSRELIHVTDISCRMCHARKATPTMSGSPSHHRRSLGQGQTDHNYQALDVGSTHRWVSSILMIILWLNHCHGLTIMINGISIFINPQYLMNLAMVY